MAYQKGLSKVMAGQKTQIDFDNSVSLQGSLPSRDLLTQPPSENKNNISITGAGISSTKLEAARQEQESISIIQQQEKKRDEQRHVEMMKEVERLASEMAKEDFNNDPSKGVQAEKAKAALKAIASKYPEQFSASSVEAELVSKFRSGYESTHEALFNELSWIKQGYYSVKSWCSGAWDSLKGFGEGLVNLGKGIKTVSEVVTDVAIAAAKGAGKLVASAASTAYSVVSDKSTWQSVGRGIGKAYDFATSPNTWSAVGTGLGKAYDFVTSEKTWQKVGSACESLKNFMTNPKTWQAVGHGLKTAAGAVADFSVLCVTDPSKAFSQACSGAKAAGHFLKGVSDAIGITDLAVGIKDMALSLGKAGLSALSASGSLVRDLARVAAGQITAEELKENLTRNFQEVAKEVSKGIAAGMQAIKGAAIIAGSLIGVTDLIDCVRYAANGNWGLALMSGGFAVTALLGAGIVKTLGRGVVKTAAKEALEVAGKEIGEKVLKEVGSKLGQEVLVKTATEAVDNGVKTLAKQIMKHGEKALTHESMTAAMKESTHAAVEATLKRAGVGKLVDKYTFKLLETVESKGVRGLTRELKELGVSDARAAAKQMKKALNGGRLDKEIKDILEDGISKPIREHVETGMKEQFQTRLRSALRGELEDKSSQTVAKAVRHQAERLGKDLEKHIDDYVEAGWTGAREGIESATRKVVREGIEAAFKRHRAHRHMPDSISKDKNTFEKHAEKTATVEPQAEKIEISKKATELEAKRHVPEETNRQIRFRSEIREVNGRQLKMNYRVLADGTSELDSMQIVREAQEQAAAKSIADAAEQGGDVKYKFSNPTSGNKGGKAAA